VAAPIEIATPSKTYKPVGRCIYCGRHGYATNLQKEHIIPYGLAANALVLPKASCARCAGHTRAFEQICLRHMWWPFRTQIGAPSRTGVPDNFRVKTMRVDRVNEDGTIEYQRTGEIEVAPHEFPFIYYAYDFPPPGLLIGRHRKADLTFDTWGLLDEAAYRRFAPREHEGIHIGPSSTEPFCKLLAKIAHAYAVAELGLGTFRPFLTDWIRGNPIDGEPQWIGGDVSLHRHAPSVRLHEIGWSIQIVETTHYVVVRIRLFCFIGAPSYRVIVGDLQRPLNQFPFLDQPLYTVDIEQPFPLPNLLPLVQTHRGTRR
jgi:hypothetical protein